MPAKLDAEPDASAPALGAFQQDLLSATQAAAAQQPPHVQQAASDLQPPPAPPTTEAHFIETNHSEIVKSVQGHLLPDGGAMRIRLDPPQLGEMLIHVDVRNGVVAATLQTTNDEATRLLGHSLSQLKQTLESGGVVVDKLQVQQVAPSSHSSGQDLSQQLPDQGAFHDQQRREMLRRLWRRVANGNDELDLLA